jgi:hypothetical protein
MEEEQKQEEKVEEVKEEPKVETPKGYYIAELPTGFSKVIALGDQQVSVEELIVKMANSLKEAGILKE